LNDDVQDVLADTAFWLALIVRRDQHHQAAIAWIDQIEGRIITTEGILLELAGSLSKPDWRPHAIDLINNLRQRVDVEIVPLDTTLFNQSWSLYCERTDKAWSLVDCISFVVMADRGLQQALTTDHHFEQAGFQALMK